LRYLFFYIWKDVHKKGQEVEFRYYGYYYFYQYHKSNKNETEMQAALQAVEELKNRVSALINEDCKITDIL